MDDIALKLKNLQNQQGKLDPKPDKSNNYKPSKRLRAIRRQVYDRFYTMRDAPSRTDAEALWEEADKEFGMVTETNADDWRSNLHLPDAFSAIQTQAQETIERKSRPHLTGTEESDEPIEEFANAVMTYNMNTTGFDFQAYLSKLNASSRGTSFRMDYWRTDKRIVKDPVSVNEDGTIEYKDKEIIDFDDDYTEWVPNEYIQVDEKGSHIDDKIDMVKREIINIDEFHRIYDSMPETFDTEFVYPGGETTTRSTVFKLPKDLTEEDVEVLHYYNRSIDAYWIVANNVTILDGPLPTKHKELPLVVDYQYIIPGQFWGIGIPRVMHMLSEERNSIRNLQMDRQKIIIGGAFLHNNSYDLDDEDTQLSPGRIISVDTNGQDIRAAIQQVNLGDVPVSSFKMDELQLEDIRRATGIDDRITVSNSATTATQAAIVKESTLKRINLISIVSEMDAIIRLGKIKWSNIQFFYGIPRMEKITQDNKEREKKTYRTMSIQGKKFAIKDDNGKKSLSMEDVKGASALSLKPEFAKYLDGSFDISVDADVFTPISKAIEQTKKTEIFSLNLSNPATLSEMNIKGAMEDLLKVNNIDPKKWMKNVDNKKDMQMLAESENMVMAAGQPLAGTEGVTEDHTMVHLIFTKTAEYGMLPEVQRQIIMDHIMQEHDNNPATGSAADLMGAYGLGADQLGGGAAGEMAAGIPGMGSPFDGGMSANTSQPQPQVADLQATNFANPE